MKHILITAIAAVVLVGCGESQQSAPAPEAKPVEPVAGAKAPDISIHVAAREGNIEAVKQHLASGADVNVKGKYGRAPLHYAASNGRKEIAGLLLKSGANVNERTETGWTPLANAAEYNHKEIAELLIANGADVNAKDENGRTALDWAHGETAALLRKHGGKRGRR